jgi:hypothetical protein
MTVGELIRELQTMPADAPVVAWIESGRGDGYYDVTHARLIHVGQRGPHGIYPEFRMLEKRNTVRAVTID